MRLDVTIAEDGTVALVRVFENAEERLEALTRYIETDTRPYVKNSAIEQKTHIEDSAASISDFASGEIVWSGTDDDGHQYAGHAYSDPHVDSPGKTKATAEWARVAKEHRAKTWAKYLKEHVL